MNWLARIVALSFITLIAWRASSASAHHIDEPKSGGTISLLLHPRLLIPPELISDAKLTLGKDASLEFSPKLEADTKYTVNIGFVDGRRILHDFDFKVGTTLASLTIEVAAFLRSEGLEVTEIPEFGAIRIAFTVGVNEVCCGGPFGFMSSVGLGQVERFADSSLKGPTSDQSK